MTVSTLTVVPEALASGTAPCAEPLGFPPVVDWNDGTWDRVALTRAASRDFPDWLHHVRPAAGCAHPIRLVGTSMTIEAGTGRLLSSFNTADLPDGVLYKPCGNRRESFCPSCSARYKRDAYQIVRAGLIGGKGVPESVSTHPAVFATFTAPSFGLVHTRYVKHHRCQDRKHCLCRPEPCHARRDAATCPHGRLMACYARHAETDSVLGSALCLDCYDYDAHVVWNNQAGELWRRTTIAMSRYLRKLAQQRGQLIPHARPDGEVRWVSPVRLSPGKAAEMQRRAAVHFHAIIRLDGHDPHNPDTILPPPAGFTAVDLVDAAEYAASTVAFTTTGHPVRLDGWPITWGIDQTDVRVITMSGTGQVTDAMVANYLAKYATKSTEATGAVLRRLTDETVHLYADPDGTHTERLAEACWLLGQPRTWRGLRRWAHMFGFGGHFFTKGRHYSVTFSLLRDQRIAYRRTETTRPARLAGDATTTVDAPTTLVINLLEFIGAGWLTTADARLATTSAALAREHQNAARRELAALTA